MVKYENLVQLLLKIKFKYFFFEIAFKIFLKIAFEPILKLHSKPVLEIPQIAKSYFKITI